MPLVRDPAPAYLEPTPTKREKGLLAVAGSRPLCTIALHDEAAHYQRSSLVVPFRALAAPVSYYRTNPGICNVASHLVFLISHGRRKILPRKTNCSRSWHCYHHRCGRLKIRLRCSCCATRSAAVPAATKAR